MYQGSEKLCYGNAIPEKPENSSEATKRWFIAVYWIFFFSLEINETFKEK